MSRAFSAIRSSTVLPTGPFISLEMDWKIFLPLVPFDAASRQERAVSTLSDLTMLETILSSCLSMNGESMNLRKNLSQNPVPPWFIPLDIPLNSPQSLFQNCRSVDLLTPNTASTSRKNVAGLGGKLPRPFKRFMI